MTLNSRTIKKILLPIAFVFTSVFAIELSAKAENAIQSNPQTQKPTRSAPQNSLPEMTLRVSSRTHSFATGQPITLSNVAPSTALTMEQMPVTPNAEFSRTQAGITPNPASTIAQASPSTDNPGQALPGSAPSNTPTNPANVTPSTTTPDTTTQPLTTPGTTETTPISPQNTTPGTIDTIPGTTPDTTTPGTTDTPTTQPLTTPTVTPGRGTQSGSSYIGVGGNIGIGSGDTALGEGSFAVLSKIGLTRQFSVRPSVLFTDDVTILIPVTYDFSFGEGPTGDLGFTAAPFLGVGAAISTGDGGDVGFLLTGGIDVPISREFTATASVNASVTGEAAVGILLGIGYNFSGF